MKKLLCELTAKGFVEMPRKKKESLDEMMADDLDSYSKSLTSMGVEEGYSIFPKSDYQKDGVLLLDLYPMHATCGCNRLRLKLFAVLNVTGSQF